MQGWPTSKASVWDWQVYFPAWPSTSLLAGGHIRVHSVPPVPWAGRRRMPTSLLQGNRFARTLAVRLLDVAIYGANMHAEATGFELLALPFVPPFVLWLTVIMDLDVPV